MSEIKV